MIYLFQNGAPSHVDLFDYKPKLQELDGQVIPESYVEGKRFAFLKKDATLLGQPYALDNKKSVQKVLDEAGVTVKRFVRFEVGQA